MGCTAGTCRRPGSYSPPSTSGAAADLNRLYGQSPNISPTRERRRSARRDGNLNNRLRPRTARPAPRVAPGASPQAVSPARTAAAPPAATPPRAPRPVPRPTGGASVAAGTGGAVSGVVVAGGVLASGGSAAEAIALGSATAAGTAAGTYGGYALGAALGTAIGGPVGAAIGAQVGGALGGILGGTAGAALGRLLPTGGPAIDGAAVTAPNQPATGPTGPPFTGGQLAGVRYNVRVRYFADRIEGADANSENTWNNRPGPIYGTYSKSVIDPLGRPAIEVGFLRAENTSDSTPVEDGGQGYLLSEFSGATATIISVVRSDGLPDTGGDPPGDPAIAPATPRPVPPPAPPAAAPTPFPRPAPPPSPQAAPQPPPATAPPAPEPPPVIPAPPPPPLPSSPPAAVPAGTGTTAPPPVRSTPAQPVTLGRGSTAAPISVAAVPSFADRVAEFGTFADRVAEFGTFADRAAEVGTFADRVAEFGTFEDRLAEFGTFRDRLREVEAIATVGAAAGILGLPRTTPGPRGAPIGTAISAPSRIDPITKTTAAPPAPPTAAPSRVSSPCGCNAAILNKLDALSGGATAAGATGQAASLAAIMAQLQRMQAFAEKAWQATQAQKILDVLTFIGVMHNAAFLSREVAETMSYMVGNVLNIFGIEDENGSNLDVFGWLGDTVNGFFVKVFGQDLVDDVRETWKRASAILRSASMIIWTVRSIFDGTQELLEWVGENTGKIGNALKRWGVVGFNSYSWMAERMASQDRVRRRYKRILDGLETAEDSASSFAMATGEVVEIQQEITELGEQQQRFRESVREFIPEAEPDNSDIPLVGDDSIAQAQTGPAPTAADFERGTAP